MRVEGEVGNFDAENGIYIFRGREFDLLLL